jgi:hypothetical protein
MRNSLPHILSIHFQLPEGFAQLYEAGFGFMAAGALARSPASASCGAQQQGQSLTEALTGLVTVLSQ